MATVLASRNCNHATCQGECRRAKKEMPVRTPIRRASKKRAKQERQYTGLRKRFLQANPDCQANVCGCSGKAEHIHHMAGRIGDDLTDVDNFLAVCPECHHWIETHPVEAKALCLSISRLQVTKKDRTTYAPEEAVV
ncbi:HNH endonuclease signature motif containing protein [Paraflavitalea sp. CAU 1676]|uniref:HNH endonuclease signature motif containing protein n=1 Tax=Paraflavitalea sp. CAU 1676 TaxID=3032598 RepID=UPI0023DAF58F|nr:HNH endonuclease signature motif containing protein [Paraflavitalea sp. CAU 1676]MDF2189322.1 HNH endonuclease signature motif containing protein [Paraflavitalea sp. CAU 1676]